MEEKVTIFDVARRAGVSKGTVDRVLHNRGEVSEKTVRKVRKAIEETGYEPNLYASLLATRTPFVIACLLPEIQQGTYWEKINRGLVQGGDQVSALNVRVRMFYYDQYDSESFSAAASDVLESNPSGVILPPLFPEAAAGLAASLRSRGIPYAFVDSRIEDPGYLAYFGMPMYGSGVLCAALLTERMAAEDVREALMVRISRGDRSDPTVERRAGFNDYMTEHFPACRLDSLTVSPDDPDGIDAALDAYFEAHPDVKLVVMCNSRVHLLGRWLAAHKDPARRVIGFDDLDANVAMLRNSDVSILITRRTEKQSADAVSTLSDYILMRRRPDSRDNYAHMDILTRFNIENYG